MINRRRALRKVPVYPLSKFSRKDKTRLDLNENTRGCSPRVLDAIRNIDPQVVATYPEYDQLVAKIAKYHGLKPTNVLLTNGADEAIRCVMETYLNRHDEVVTAVPSYSMFKILVKINEARLVEIPYEEKFSFPLKKLLAAITERTKIIIVVNPNSPTGSSIARDDFIQILKNGKDAVVLLDESYSHYLGATWAELIRDFNNLIVTQTFSKAFGLAGLRLGYILSDSNNIENLNVVKLPFSVNTLAVVAGCAALEDELYLKDVVEQNELEKKFLYEKLEESGVNVIETDTNFLLIDLGEASHMVYNQLLTRGILVKELKDFPELKGYLRITIGTHGENLLLAEVLKDILPPQVILFDMDGVLVDVSKSYRLAIKKTAEYYLKDEVALAEITKRKMKGGYNNDWLLTEAIIKDRGTEVGRDEIVKKFQEFYLGRNYDGFIRNEKWLLDLRILKRLKKDYRLGIVTGRPRSEAQYALNRFGVAEFFDVLVAMEDVESREKPDPYGIKLALGKLSAKRGLYVGDNIDDIKSAKLARVTAVGIVASSMDEAEAVSAKFFRTGASNVVKSVNEIARMLSSRTTNGG